MMSKIQEQLQKKLDEAAKSVEKSEAEKKKLKADM